MKLALIGAGLLGGSTAAAWRRAGVASQVCGFDLDPTQIADGVAAGVLDRGADTLAAAVAGADCVVLAVPVGAMPAVLAQLAPALAPTALVTDVGSTKLDVIAAARAALGPAFARFVPGHPIAGGELPGIAHADATLFEGRQVITTPVDATDDQALRRIEAAWIASGAKVERMDAAEHDRVFAAISHLPHLLAFALVAQVASEADGERKLGFAGAGFRDFTRIAASSAPMWRDIALANRAALGDELRIYQGWLARLQQALEQRDGEALNRIFELASDTRRRQRRLDAGREQEAGSGD